MSSRSPSIAMLVFMVWLGFCAGTETPTNAPTAPTAPTNTPTKARRSSSDVRRLLMDFYNATSGPRWTINNGWGSASDHCNGWYGVTCSSTGEIKEILVVNNGLSGSLPASLSSFTHMAVFMADNGNAKIRNGSNHLSGTLPASFSSLSQFKRFYVRSNALSGSLPATWSSFTFEFRTLNSNSNPKF